MWFLGMLAGVMAGALMWGFQGAVILGFFGFMAGLILGGKRPAAGAAGVPSPEDRVSRLEQRVAQLERRLQHLERQPDKALQTITPQESVRASVPADDSRADGQAGAEHAAAPAGAQGAVRAASPEPAGAMAQPATGKTARLTNPGDGVLAPPPAAPDGRESVARAAESGKFPNEGDESLARPNFIVRWFTEGNAIVRVGMTILFIGVAFLIRYAAERDLVPIELRLACAAAGGLALLALGWRLRDARSGYALTMQGAGVAVLYLTVFGAYRIWHVLPAALAFPLLVAMAVLSALLAIRQDAVVLAVAGTAGGFLAPVLASTGQGSHVMLFSYYLILNLGVLAIAWHKAWRVLNLLGFLCTFVIGLLWAGQYYRPAFFASTEPFLIIHFLLYVAVAILFAHRAAPRLAHYADGTLIFGVPLVAFGMQYGLVRDTEYGLAFSSLALSAFYLACAGWLWRRSRESLQLLVESFIALGVVFGTLAIPLALDAKWTAAAWALEGAGIVWIGRRQNRLLARLFGMLLQLLAAGAFLLSLARGGSATLPLLNSGSLGALLLVLGALLTYRQLARKSEVSPVEHVLAGGWFAWSLCWWLVAGFREIDLFILSRYQATVAVVFLAGTALIGSLLWLKRQWREAEWPVWGLLPALYGLALFKTVDQGHPFAAYGAPAFAVALVVHYANLRHHDQGEGPRAVLGWIHAGTGLLLAAMGSVELHWWCEEQGLANSGWATAAIMLVPLGMLGLLGHGGLEGVWPLRRYAEPLRKGAGIPLVICFIAWVLFANFGRSGSNAPLPYLPILSALDLTHILGGLVCVHWWRRLGVATDEARTRARTVAGILAFIWMNGMLLRCLHHWVGVPYRAAALWESMLVQASVSLFWTLLALTLMLVATRRSLRFLWMTGAGLMGVVVAKLFLVDLSNIDGIERIVSFIGVGILMAVIGYFSPLPPRRVDAREGT